MGTGRLTGRRGETGFLRTHAHAHDRLGYLFLRLRHQCRTSVAPSKACSLYHSCTSLTCAIHEVLASRIPYINAYSATDIGNSDNKVANSDSPHQRELDKEF
jgi:hypothetical protein